MDLDGIVLGLSIGVALVVMVYLLMRVHLKNRIAIIEAEFRKLWAEQEGHLRRDVAQRSRSVLKGKIAEQIVPLLHDVFKHDPSDARFIGSPIDYVIFDNYSHVKDGTSDGPITVVLADVKTGSARLNRTERMIKDAVEAGRVKWETIRLDLQ